MERQNYLANRKIAVAFRRYLRGESPAKKYKHLFDDVETLQRFFAIQLDKSVVEMLFTHGTEWVIDHVVPVTFFDHKAEIEIRHCWNWRNLRAIHPKDNRVKGHSAIEALWDINRRIEVFGDDDQFQYLKAKIPVLVSSENPYLKFVR